MRKHWLISFFALFLAATDAFAFAHEGRYEFSERGDFNGDGLSDIVIVDRVSGVFRVGYQAPGGLYNWADPRASGMENVDAMSVGKLFQTTRDSLAVASSAGNRVNLFDIPTATGAPIPTSVFTAGIGPNLVVAIDIPGGTAHADLVIGSNENGPVNPGRIALVRNNAGATSILLDAVYPDLRGGNRLFLKKTGPEFFGAMDPNGASDDFKVFSPTAASVNLLITVAGETRGSRFLSGNFSGGAFNHTLFYRPGQSNFVSHPSSEPVPGTYAIGAGIVVDLGTAISQLIALPGATAERLFALFEDGSGSVYDYNGTGASPVLVQKVNPDPGEKITAVLPNDSDNGFIAFSGTGNQSMFARAYTKSGGGYTAGPKTSLPGLTPLSGDANIFLFKQEPFVSSTPGLLRSLSAGDWTSDLAFALPNFSATIWNFEGGSLGLRNPVNVNFGPVAPTTSFGLINQYHPAISLFSKSPAVGDEVVEIKISPEPGEFKAAIQVSLTSTLAGAQIWYRLSAGDGWTPYASPFTLFKTTTVQYYGNPLASTTKSRIHTAQFTFPITPGVQDSDRDGIPDFVEIARGLNPNGGKDQDGDGFTDFNEMVANTNPLTTNSVPTDAQRLEEKSAFDLIAGLQPINGPTGLQTTAGLSVGMRIYDLFGNLFRANVSSNLGIATVTDPAVRNTNILQITDPPLIVAATDAHFDIVTAGADKKLGRELLEIVPVPRPPFPQVVYTYGGGNLATEANGWVAAAQALFAALPREIVKENLSLNDTLVALMFERKISKILFERGNPAWSNLTLFPFRPTDNGRTNPPSALLSSLAARLDDTHPGYRLDGILIGLNNAVTSTVPAELIQLKTLASEIYRISSASNNAAPAKYPSPVDTLRQFLETGILHSNYVAGVVAPIDLTAALNAYNTALSNVTGRATVNLDLVVRSDTFGGSCSRLDTAALPAVQKTLVHPGGAQYRLLEAFNLLPGSHVHVFGYSDALNPACAGDAIEVISIALDSVPETSAVDQDGDLLLDALELLLFGSLSNSAFGDADGDGFSNLQELMDGTDPSDSGAHGPMIVNLSLPEVEIITLGNGDILLNFDWPAQYFDDIHFVVKSTSALGTGFINEPISPVNMGGNSYQVHLPNPGSSQKYYQLALSLL